MSSLALSLASSSLYPMRAAFVILATSLLSPTSELPPATGFTLCARPNRPACIKDITGGKAANCEPEVKAFVAAVVIYRDCLEQEVQRAVREANDVVEQMKGKQFSPRPTRPTTTQ
jgi:hypothetical protein